MEEDLNVEQMKAYKEKPNLNSNKEPFGLTIKGKSKAYITAHKSVQSLIIKGKTLTTKEGKMKILDASHNKGMINAIVEVNVIENELGNVEMKFYDPSLDKKKGATVELRKMSDFDYSHVEKLKSIVTCLLDKFLSEKDLNHKPCGGFPGGQKFFTCNICEWQTRFEPALKGHKKRMHANPNVKSKDEGFLWEIFQFKTKSKATMMVHGRMNHKEETKKRLKVTIQCKVSKLESTFDNQGKLSEHMKIQHNESTSVNFVDPETESLSSSPPRKKLEKQIDEANEEMLDLDNMEIKIENELNINFLLEKRIKELEIQVAQQSESKQIKELEVLVATLLEEKAKDEEFKSNLINNIEELKTQTVFKVPKHLSSVHAAHLQQLKGLKMIYNSLGNGRCLENSVAVHIFENEDEGESVKKKINNHIADNWDEYYQNKLTLPYKETVGVGEMLKQ